jgi:hypothetical protein
LSLGRSEALVRRDVLEREERRNADRGEAHDGSKGSGPRDLEAVHEQKAKDCQRGAAAGSDQNAPPLIAGGGDQHDDDVKHGDGELQRAEGVENEDADGE